MNSKALRSFVFAILAFVAGTYLLCKPRSEGPTPVSGAPAVRGAPAAAAAAAPPGVATPEVAAPEVAAPEVATPEVAARPARFRSKAALDDHFARHGAEFDAASPAAYLALAQALRDAPVGGDVLEIVRPSDGVISRFDRASGAFIAFNRDGTIRTFFKPNDGEAYFRRQARRLPGS